jgi:hypothetical protein
VRTPDNAALRRYEPEPANVQRVISARSGKPVMKILGTVLSVALASMIAIPGAQARPRIGLGLALMPLAIVGGIAGAAIGSRKARAHRGY